ncbi:MAG TPA: pitrilysin family protein [Syntrophales bacterium]|nr:pitrilysin family protein [Syntrophales bacterium]
MICRRRYRRAFLSTLVTTVLFLVIDHLPLSGFELEQRVQKHVLSNGLTVLLCERHLSPTVSLYIRYRAGAVDEGEGKTGMAHLLEHMMFKGTRTIGTRNFQKERGILEKIAATGRLLDKERRKEGNADAAKVETLTKRLAELQQAHRRWMISNEIDRLYTENGATDLNASTGQDLITYHVSLPANKIELWARIESDRMRNTVFREFFAERDVVMEERRQRSESDPGGKLYEQFVAAAFTAHPYRRPILGWPSDMRNLDMDSMAAFYRRTHAPNNTVIAAVGDLRPDAVMKLIRRYFGSIPRQPASDFVPTEEPPQRGERRVSVLFDANPELIIGYHKPPPPDFDDYVLDVIESLLSRGRTSRFYKRLIEERGLAESVDAANGLPASRYPNLFAIFATPRHPHSARELEEAIFAEIDLLKSEPVEERELTKIKNQVKANYLRGLNANEGLAGILSYYEALLGDYRYAARHADRIERITSADVHRAARKYFDAANRTVATIVKGP